MKHRTLSLSFVSAAGLGLLLSACHVHVSGGTGKAPKGPKAEAPASAPAATPASAPAKAPVPRLTPQATGASAPASPAQAPQAGQAPAAPSAGTKWGPASGAPGTSATQWGPAAGAPGTAGAPATVPSATAPAVPASSGAGGLFNGAVPAGTPLPTSLAGAMAGVAPSLQAGAGVPAAAFTVPAISAAIPFGSGTVAAFKGSAYALMPNTTAMPNFDQNVPFATLYTESFDVQPQSFAGDFPGALQGQEAFGIRYEGDFAIAKQGTYGFKLTSDDGAIFSVDGEVVLSNDGVHEAKTVSAEKTLRSGNHRLRLDYFRASGKGVALQLQIVDGNVTAPLRGIAPKK